MKILHVTAGIQETCGVSCFVMETARAQASLGHDVCIVTSMTCGYPVGSLNVQIMDDPTGVEFSPDIVHLHCIWNIYVHKMAVWCRERKIPYVISPHGTLTPWALKFKWWKKLPALVLYQYRDLLHAAAFHVTAGSEHQDIPRLRLKQPILTAPLGVSIPAPLPSAHQSHDILFLSRIHPKKGLDTLLQAWAAIPTSTRHSWRLIIAGPDDIGYLAELKTLAEALHLTTRDFSKELAFGKKQIHGGQEVPLAVYQEKMAANADVVFTGPVYSETKNWLYQNARFFVLPSHSENFGGVVLEALAAGTPVITTTGTPWKALEEHGCGWWIDDTTNALKLTLSSVLQLSSDCYGRYSQKAIEYVQNSFSWFHSSKILLQGYEKIV